MAGVRHEVVAEEVEMVREFVGDGMRYEMEEGR